MFAYFQLNKVEIGPYLFKPSNTEYEDYGVYN